MSMLCGSYISITDDIISLKVTPPAAICEQRERERERESHTDREGLSSISTDEKNFISITDAEHSSRLRIPPQHRALFLRLFIVDKQDAYISTHDAENIISFSWPCEGRHSPRRGERKAPQREERVLRRMHFEGRRRGIPAICSRDVRFAETLKLPPFGDPEFRSLRRPYLHTFADFVDFVMPRRDALQYHFVTAPPRPVPRGGVSCEKPTKSVSYLFCAAINIVRDSRLRRNKKRK